MTLTTPFYSADPVKPDSSRQIPASRTSGHSSPNGYLPDAGLVDAVNVALILGQPLLVTGEPGTGKTQLAYSLAWQLGFTEPLKFETKSTSTSRDLFYYYDTVARFHAAQTKSGSQDPLTYLTYNALGAALLQANNKADVKSSLPEGFEHRGPCRSVVLIDEVDKAPRDFPNDILNEVEGMYFKIPELGNLEVSAKPDMRPILVITSNSEKHLPDAFLRRCVYYHIPFPDVDRLNMILEARIGEGLRGSPFLSDALELFGRLRHDDSDLRKKPATAELLSWITALRESAPKSGNPLRERPELAQSTLSAVVKTAEDRDAALDIVSSWIAEQR